MAHGFGPAEPGRSAGRPGGRTFKPGGVDRSIYFNAPWALELYELLKDVISDMDDLTDSEGYVTLDHEVKSRELRSFARVLVERVNAAVGRGTLEKAIDDAKLVQVPVTPKEQAFLIEIAVAFDLGEDSLEELRKLPAKGWY